MQISYAEFFSNWEVNVECKDRNFLHHYVKNGCHCTKCNKADNQSIHFHGQTCAVPDFLQMNVEECKHCVQKVIPPHFYSAARQHIKMTQNTKHSSECLLCFHTSFPHVLFL